MLAGKRRDDDIRQTEADLGGESLLGDDVGGIGSGIAGMQIAVHGGRASGRNARVIAVGIDCDGADVGVEGFIGGIGVVVGVAGHGRHVFVRTSAFVVAEEEDGAAPGGAGHEGVDDLRDLALAFEDGLRGARMLVIEA